MLAVKTPDARAEGREALARKLAESLLDEIFRGLEGRYGGLLRRHASSLFRKAASRFAAFLARADAAAGGGGLYTAALSMLQDIQLPYRLLGEAHVPSEGPLIVASNHPAGYDMLVLAAGMRRKDLAVIASDLPLYHEMKAVVPHIIGVSPGEGGRFTALRKAVAHLQAGGALLQFPAGRIEADPQCEPGASAGIQAWKPSLEVFLRKEPRTQLVLAMASGVLERRFRYSPVTWLRSHPKDKRRLAEFVQVSRMLLTGRKPRQATWVSFSEPMNLGELGGGEGHARILQSAQETLKEHLRWLAGDGLPALS